MCSCPYSYNRMATAVTYFYYRSLTYHEYILPETNKFNWTTQKRSFDEMFRFLVLCVCFVDRCLSLCPCSFGHCVVCPSLIYGFWLPLWYLQTLLAASANYFFLSLPTMYIVRLLVNKSKASAETYWEEYKHRFNRFHKYLLIVRIVPKSSRKIITANIIVVKNVEYWSWLYLIATRAKVDKCIYQFYSGHQLMLENT